MSMAMLYKMVLLTLTLKPRKLATDMTPREATRSTFPMDVFRYSLFHVCKKYFENTMVLVLTSYVYYR